MSMRTRTVSWCEGNIVKVLSEKCQITTYMALSSCVLVNVRSIEEQHNLDIAVAHLLSKKQITQVKDQEGFTVYRLAA